MIDAERCTTEHPAIAREGARQDILGVSGCPQAPTRRPSIRCAARAIYRVVSAMGRFPMRRLGPPH
jgi:hypothetical protein